MNIFRLLCLFIVVQCYAVKQEDFEVCIQQVMGVSRVIDNNYCIVKESFACKTKSASDLNIMILEGEPGCGKTTLAKEFAMQTDSLYILVKCGELSSSSMMGSASKSIIEAFTLANNYIRNLEESVVIIFDEIDSFAKQVQPPAQNNETENAFNTLKLRLDENRNNENLVVVGTTNYFDLLPESLKSRCVRVPIKAPAKHEYVGIIKNLLIDGSAKSVVSLGDKLFKTYKSPGDIIQRNLQKITKLVYVQNIEFTEPLDQSNSFIQPSLYEITTKNAQSCDISGINNQVLLRVVRETIKTLESLSVDIKARNIEFVVWALEHLKQWSHDIKGIDCEALNQLVARAQLANWSEHFVPEKAKKILGDIFIKIEHLCQSPYNPIFFETLKATILDFKTEISQCDDSLFKKSCDNFLKKLDIFVKVYVLVHDDAKMRVLYSGEYSAIRVVERMVTSIKHALGNNKELGVKELTYLRDNAISKNKQKKMLPEWLARVADPITEFGREYEPGLRVGGMGTAAAGSCASYVKNGYDYFTKQPAQQTPSPHNASNNQQKAQADVAKNYTAPSSEQSHSLTSGAFSPATSATSLAHDPQIGQWFPGVDAKTLDATMDHCAASHQNSASTDNSSASGVLGNIVPIISIVENAYEAYRDLKDLHATIKGTKDHLSPHDRFMVNQHQNELDLNKKMQEAHNNDEQAALEKVQQQEQADSQKELAVSKEKVKKEALENQKRRAHLEARKKTLNKKLEELAKKKAEQGEKKDA